MVCAPHVLCKKANACLLESAIFLNTGLLEDYIRHPGQSIAALGNLGETYSSSLVAELGEGMSSNVQ